jgi:hypothetical protein
LTASCILASWLSFLVGIGAGAILLAIILHYVDKAMRK